MLKSGVIARTTVDRETHERAMLAARLKGTTLAAVLRSAVEALAAELPAAVEVEHKKAVKRRNKK